MMGEGASMPRNVWSFLPDKIPGLISTSIHGACREIGVLRGQLDAADGYSEKKVTLKLSCLQACRYR